MTGAVPDIELWLVDLALAAPALDGAWREAAGAATPATSPAAAEAALRWLLARHVGLVAASEPFARSRSGRPSLAGAGIDFNLSHSGGLALVGLSHRGPIGVDIEAARPVRIAPARRRALERAADALVDATTDPLPGLRPAVSDDAAADLRFLQAWVRLEALAKATGEGIGALLTRIGRAPSTARLGAVAADVRRSGLTVCDLVLPTDWPIAANAVAVRAVGACAVGACTPRASRPPSLPVRRLPDTVDGLAALLPTARAAAPTDPSRRHPAKGALSASAAGEAGPASMPAPPTAESRPTAAPAQELCKAWPRAVMPPYFEPNSSCP